MSVSKRIVEVVRNMLLEGETEVRPERIPAALADQFLGRPLPPIRSDVPENTQKPGCTLGVEAFHVSDLEIRWNRIPGAARYQVRDVTGLTGTPRQIWEAGTIIDTVDATELVVVDKGPGTAPDPAAIDEVMVEPFNKYGVPGECYESVTVSRLSLGQPCPNLMEDPAVTETHCSPGPGVGPVILYTFLPTVAANHAGEIVPGTTRVALCHQGATTGEGTFGQSGYISYTWGVITGFGRANGPARLNPFTVFGQAFFGVSEGNPLWLGVSSIREGSQNRLRMMSGGALPTRPDWLTAPRNPVDTVHFGLTLQPGVRTVDLGVGDTATSYCLYSNGHTTNVVTVEDLSSHKIRVQRTTTDAYVLTATVTSGLQSGDGVLDLQNAGNDTGGGWWDRVAILDSGDVEQAVFLASEHPRGKCWAGDRYKYDSGGGLAIDPECLAVNAAGTMCLIEEGFIYEEDWTKATPVGGLPDPAKYTSAGGVALQNGRLELSGHSAIVLRTDKGVFLDCVAEAVLQRPGAGSAPICPAVLSSAGDVRATLRATFLDAIGDPIGTPITGAGVASGDLGVFVPETVLAGEVWPATAVELQVEQLQIGTDSGEACSRNVQLNVGSGCCQFKLPDIPNPTGPCLNPLTVIVNSIDDCTGATGLNITVQGSINSGDPCDKLSDANGYHWKFTLWEESDPSTSPGFYDPVKTLTDPIPFPAISTDPADPPAFYQFSTTVTDEAGPGLVRGTNGGNQQLRRWRCTVSVDNIFLPSQPAVRQTSNDATPPSQYGFCP